MHNPIVPSNFIFQDNTIREDELVNISALASAYQKATISPEKPNGIRKNTRDWLVTKEAQDSIAYLVRATRIPVASLVITENGVGTWVHPDLAEIFAQWISVEYRFAVVRLIRDTKENIAAEKEKKQFPNRITGNVPVNPAGEFAYNLRGVVDAIFTDLEPEFRTGIVIEGVCNKHPEFRPALESYKPRMILEAPLLSPTELGKILAARTGLTTSGQAINKILLQAGLQEKTGQENPTYRAIGQGIEFSKVVADTAKKHGKTVVSLRWYESVLNLI